MSPPKVRRRAWATIVGAGALVVGALIGLFVWMAASTTQQVLVAATDLDKYHVITVGDLRVVPVTLDASVASVSSTEAATLIGQRLASAVPEGSVLAPADVSKEQFPPSGRTVVQVAFNAQQAAGVTFQPGDDVRVVVAPPTATDAEPTFSAGEIAAVHTSTSGAVVDVLVPHADAVDLSVAIANGRASIVHDAGPVLSSDDTDPRGPADKGGED
ncbi:SAF domain-containing protein [Myceligenerans xiligouense]|uniref:SAF domain-containing protein n=1 Tax=Myceligenerans xiligouense TaxID=253184 RepID=UPI001476FCE7|nr:SAF domain-containing protein [Myceligenerans xiligouense]